ncbi:DNA methyltransferase [Christiangramia sediminis]|uniref:site-specific DNA-methyltransferase (adenine-specific) n=1 Tax=Christiangramia sediminis TaxID=2881336 RepID=A0A9X1RYX7_9FLAO|nr:DNA methyltransferase [Christiangramia sediminis]MCB7482224.1 helix-turn-helix domain-containing protein [Christiangramia sediminis]
MRNTDFLTLEEVAENLKVTRQTVSKYIQNSDLNAIKINKSYRITVDDFKSFISENSTASEPQIKYLRKTRNCLLSYEDKIDEFEILNTYPKGDFQVIEQNHGDKENVFLFGDNYFVLKKLLEDYTGKIDLIYIDPPFGTGQDFNSLDNQAAYSDKLINSEFLEFIRKRLFILRELLSDEGSIYLHIDKKIGHYVKIIMDEVFGFNNFINDITRIKCNPKNFSRSAYGNYSDMVLYYVKNRDKQIWNDIRETMSIEKRKELFPKNHPQLGFYTTNPIHAPGETKDGDTGLEWNGLYPPKGRHWRYSRKVLTELDNKGLIEWSNTGNPRKIVLAKNHKGFKIQDVWEYKDKGLSFASYPTQKNEQLLKRIITNSSYTNSIVLDCFAGSGSTLKAANELNRRWIGIDNSTHSYNVIKKNFEKESIKCNFLEYISRD